MVAPKKTKKLLQVNKKRPKTNSRYKLQYRQMLQKIVCSNNNRPNILLVRAKSFVCYQISKMCSLIQQYSKVM